MGFLDKLKNTFFEEEYVEVEEKPKKQVIKEKKVVKKEVVEEPKEVIKEEVKEEIKEEETIPVKESKFSYFDEDDFLDYEPPKKDIIKQEEMLERIEQPVHDTYDIPVYGSKKINTNVSNSPYSRNENVTKKFTPTPIISPIYGVLDKNYTKEEIQDKKEVKATSSYVSRKNADLDSIRKKAYGNATITEDLGLVEEKQELPIIEEDDIIEDNLLYDMTEVDKTPSVDKVTLQDAEEYFEDLGLEYNIDYKDVKLEKATGRRVNKTHPIDEIEDMEDDFIVPEEETVKIIEDEEETSLEDNLFDLIDSMYEDKE